MATSATFSDILAGKDNLGTKRSKVGVSDSNLNAYASALHSLASFSF